MGNKKNKIFDQAMLECIDEDMKGVVFNENLQQFSTLRISNRYKDRIKVDSVQDWFDSSYPNAAKYNVYTKSYLNDEEMDEMWLIHDSDRKEQIIKILKKVHNIRDPWDDDPDYFKTHKPGDEL